MLAASQKGERHRLENFPVHSIFHREKRENGIREFLYVPFSTFFMIENETERKIF